MISQKYRGVKEDTSQLVQWLQKLKDDLATVPDGIDPEEAERCAELSWSAPSFLLRCPLSSDFQLVGRN